VDSRPWLSMSLQELWLSMDKDNSGEAFSVFRVQLPDLSGDLSGV